MASSSHPPKVERARPLLGTLVQIRVEGAPESDAHGAITRAFAEIETVHRLMSFHEAESDLGTLNRTAHREAVAVHAYTYEVLSCALDLARESSGVFDPSIGFELAGRGLLPRPEGAPLPEPGASWRDIELLDGGRVKFHRPLWLDFGGIAKGYAVDKAVSVLNLGSGVQVCVNAGGDLRAAGPRSERVLLDARGTGEEVPVLEIENGSLASSSGYDRTRPGNQSHLNAHMDGVSRRTVGGRSFVSVLAEECMIADALTKIVLAKGLEADAILRRRGAAALFHTARSGWRTLGKPND